MILECKDNYLFYFYLLVGKKIPSTLSASGIKNPLNPKGKGIVVFFKKKQIL